MPHISFYIILVFAAVSIFSTDGFPNIVIFAFFFFFFFFAAFAESYNSYGRNMENLLPTFNL